MTAMARLARIPVPSALARAWDRSSSRERVLAAAAAAVVLFAVAWAGVWQPMQDDALRTRRDLQRDRAALAVARAQAEEITGLNRATQSANAGQPEGDPRLPIERVLGERALKASLTSLEVKESRAQLVFTAIGFDALVGMLDALAKTDGLRPVELTLTSRVEPGTVRAEVTLAR
jgi:type II secretory pathway component PulM